jgi:integrase
VIGRVLKLLLFRIAASKPEWEAAYLAAVIAANTTCRKIELLSMKWATVYLFAQVVNIRRSKTQAGHRSIPLSPESLAPFSRLRRRVEGLGGGTL